MKRRVLAVILTVIFSLIVCLGTFIVIWFWGDTYEDFNDFSAGVEIPGLADGSVPQGLGTYNGKNPEESGQKQQYFFISSYMKSGPSRVYVTASRTGYVGYVTLKTEDGQDFFGHCGGIATNCTLGNKNGSVWITSDDKVFVIRRTDSSPSSDTRNIADLIIEKAQLSEGNEIAFTASFEANCNASFCYYYDDGTTSTTSDRLYVGEFYRKGNYETDESHHVTTKSGDENRAFAYEYIINNNSKYGLNTITATGVDEENRVPKINYIYSIPDKIQGFARIKGATASSSEGKLVLSQSYGLPNSKIYYYDWAKVYSSSNRTVYDSLTGNSFTYKGIYYKQSGSQTPVPYTEKPYVYFVDDSCLVREYSVPSMSEGLCAANDRVYVLFESGCYKYRTFVRRQIKNVYSFVPRT